MTIENVVSHIDKIGRGESHWQDKTRQDKTRQDEGRQDEGRQDMVSHTNKTGCDATPTRQDVVSHIDKTGPEESYWQDRTWWVTSTRQDLRSHTDKTGRQSAPVRTTKYNQSRWPVKVEVRSIAPVTVLRPRKWLQRHRRYLSNPLIKVTHFTALIILGVERRSWSASQCNFTQSPVNC